MNRHYVRSLALSHKKARQLKSWDRVNEALEKDEIIKGYIKCRTKGGMIVDVFGIEAFLPGSQIDVKPIRDYDVYVDKTMEFKVVKINQEFRNVVVSHKALIEAELEAQKQVIMSKLEKGQILEGTVKNITSYGVFVDLGGVDGLIHITDLSWGRVNHPEEIVALDQKINVVILDFDEAKKRIALGLKQLTPHPWEALDQTLKVGDKVKGRVVVMADYGAFVEIAPGVEGLIHVSEMSWSQHLRSAQEFMKVGDEVEAVILTLDREERKMSLGIKQLTPDPWENIEVKYPVGTKTTAKVRNFTNFGVFVEIEEGIDGLIHISDLSWTKKVKHPGEFTSVGADIEVVVLEIDKENRRLSLGHKQLEENPWNEFENQYSVDSIHEGTITEMTDKGAVVALGENIEGFCPARQLVKEDGTTPKTGDKLNFKILEFSKATKRITLSHLRTYEEAKRAEIAISDAGNDVGARSQLLVDDGRPDRGGLPRHVLHGIVKPLLAGDDRGDMGMGRRTALLAQGVVGQHERRSGGQHRIDQQQCLAFEASARDVLDLHGELAVLGALAIGRDEGVLGVVEVVEKPLMIGKSRTENRRHHDLLVDHLDGGFTQRRLDNARFVAERFRYFVGRDLADALHVAAWVV